MNPFDLSDMPSPEYIFEMKDDISEDLSIPDGREFSPQTGQQQQPVQQIQPTAPMGAAPAAAPVEPRPQPAPVAKATGGYSSLTQSQTSSQDSRADSLFGG